jgi:ornithine carbamoyltransferase
MTGPISFSPPRHFLSLQDFSAATLRGILDLAADLKTRLKAGDRPRLLEDKTLAMIFERQSTRTRVSFDVGMRQLGGETLMLTGQEMQLAREETLADTARVMSRYVDAIMIRILDHDDLMELAGASTVPVINGLTRRDHPCQVMADIMTFEEHRGPIKGKKIAWVGDSNNVMASWVHATRLFGNTLAIACPEEFGPDQAMRADIKRAGAGVRGDQRRRSHHHRYLGLDGRHRCQRAPQGLETLPGRHHSDGPGQVGCAVHALPARSPRRRSHRRGH